MGERKPDSSKAQSPRRDRYESARSRSCGGKAPAQVTVTEKPGASYWLQLEMHLRDPRLLVESGLVPFWPNKVSV